MASGRTKVASVPALYTSNWSFPSVRSSPSAICERAELCVQMNSIRRFMPIYSFLFFSGLASADEGADELPIQVGAFGFGERGNRGAGSAIGNVLHGVAARHLDFDIYETSFGQQLPVNLLFKRPGDAARPCLKIALDRLWQPALNDDIRDGETPARYENTVSFAQYLPFIGREVDDAVGNDDIHLFIRQRNGLDHAFQEAHIFHSRLSAVALRQCQHGIGHIQPIGKAGWPHALRREQHIYAAPAA